ncbi:MAG: thioredoxin-disulfide reductase [Firmicutes bacterium]|nr:thioredoxin-disulfide reductase [Bacillota bacterium]
MEIYDVIIIGGGPAGLTAGLYTARAKLKTLLFERGLPGGQASTTDLIENYPGFPQGIAGPELMMNFQEQAMRFGMELKIDEVIGLEIGEPKKVKTVGGVFQARTIIIASGAKPRPLGVRGELEFWGRGVSYCATCDGAFFKSRNVVVVGGGDAALEEGLFLTKYANRVTLVHRRDQFRAARIIQERVFNNPKIDIRWDTVVEEIKGGDKVEKVVLRHVKTNQKEDFVTDGVFVFIGVDPNSDFLKDIVTLTPEGYVITNQNLETNVPGLFAAGDVRNKILRQVSTAVGDGALAAVSAERYLASLGI